MPSFNCKNITIESMLRTRWGIVKLLCLFRDALSASIIKFVVIKEEQALVFDLPSYLHHYKYVFVYKYICKLYADPGKVNTF